MAAKAILIYIYVDFFLYTVFLSMLNWIEVPYMKCFVISMHYNYR